MKLILIKFAHLYIFKFMAQNFNPIMKVWKNIKITNMFMELKLFQKTIYYCFIFSSKLHVLQTS
jgi:hypothetical protein